MKQIICFLFLLCCSIAVQAQDPALLRKAQAGDADAQYELACFYLPRDKSLRSEEGMKWLTKAAENGNAKAQWDLSIIYMYGLHCIDKNDEKYVYWLKITAYNINDLQKNKWFIAYAQYHLGKLYENGEHGLEKNMSEFLKLTHEAANNDYAVAASSLGWFYTSVGDKQEAIYWYKKAMDVEWQKSHRVYETASKYLRELGVTYHPADNVGHSDMASRNSSASTVKGDIWFENNLIGEWNYEPKKFQIPEGCLITYRFRKDGTGYRGIYSDIYSDEEHFHWEQGGGLIIIQYESDGKEVFDIDLDTVTESKMIDNLNGEFHRLTR